MWSDFPFVSFKRWIKSIGILVMVLVVFSESDPVNAVKTVLRRCAYVLVPLSVVFIKYYPDLGRSYSRWTGEAYYHGVATTKNGLGFLCLFSGIYFFWDLLAMWRKRNTHFDKQKVFIHIVFLIMVLWLLRMADSATSTMCFITGVFILVWTELPIMKRNVKAIGGLVLFYALVFLILILLSDVEVLVSSMGRDMTLTGRLDLWNQLIDIEINPLVGTGYESFWLGARAEEFWARYWWRPNQSHNGYLETYLNLGWIGTLLLVVVIISAYQKSTRTFLLDYDYGKFRLTFLVMVLFYNVTEAAFHGVHLMRFFFILVAMDFPRLGQLRIQGSIQERRSPEIQSIEV
ncbi:O-antigen ligase family protein [candidate division KSB1 bacterium]|nr:O-antigen ligase family protein [candidate division KSB1 bacterium]NIS26133.1 O-antigen ligase family protein [candidate division KSB1 bacterium]NIU26772.1 O-antigen ligase family protein [candidate division KSB1 bacterium]NIU92206.1 O-antigen ligase family protein [candidate division KSB1 bacterium]NIW20652.1 O-antigen ligase family protein [candidate division KSB1 bacterium]